MEEAAAVEEEARVVHRVEIAAVPGTQDKHADSITAHAFLTKLLVTHHPLAHHMVAEDTMVEVLLHHSEREDARLVRALRPTF